MLETKKRVHTHKTKEDAEAHKKVLQAVADEHGDKIKFSPIKQNGAGKWWFVCESLLTPYSRALNAWGRITDAKAELNHLCDAYTPDTEAVKQAEQLKEILNEADTLCGLLQRRLKRTQRIREQRANKGN